MSEEGGTSLSVGFFMPYADALRPFAFEKAEVSHEEDRFHPKTGKKVGTEKVVDAEGGWYVKLPGDDEEWGPVRLGDDGEEQQGSPAEDGTEEFLEALGGVLGCQVESFGGECPLVGFNVALKGDYADDSYDPTCHMSAGPSLYLGKVMEMADRVRSLSKAMKAVGLKPPSKAVVYSAFTVCY